MVIKSETMNLSTYCIFLEIVIYLADTTGHEAEEASSGISGMELIMNGAQTMELSCCTLWVAQVLNDSCQFYILTKYNILNLN